MAQRFIAADGTPQYAILAEQWLVGGAMLARAEDVPLNLVEAGDFHDATLGAVWGAVVSLAVAAQDPMVPFVARRLNDWGRLDDVGAEPRLQLLAGDPLAFIYAGSGALAAHAGIVHEWGGRRRRIAELAQEAKAVHAGKVIPASHRFRGGVTFEFTEGSLA